MFTDRSRTDDKLFLVLLAVPLFFAAARFVDTESQMDQIALQNKPPVVMIAEVSAPLETLAANGVIEVAIH
jgi:hypothetical protein